MDFEKIKARITSKNFYFKIDYNDLLNWKNPLDTGLVLFLYNFAIITFLHLHMSVIHFALIKVMVYSVVFGIKMRFKPSNEE